MVTILPRPRSGLTRLQAHVQKCKFLPVVLVGYSLTTVLLNSWDRALGWYFMSLVDVLDYFPSSHSGRATLLGYLTRLAPKIAAAAEANSGIWWLVMSNPTRSGNRLESSASSMFVYAFLKAVRKGYLDGATYKPVAKKAYDYLVANYVVKETDGTLGWLGTVQVGSLGSNGSFQVSKFINLILIICRNDFFHSVLHQRSKQKERSQGSLSIYLRFIRIRNSVPVRVLHGFFGGCLIMG